MNNYFNSDSFINELRPLKDILKRQKRHDSFMQTAEHIVIKNV